MRRLLLVAACIITAAGGNGGPLRWGQQLITGRSPCPGAASKYRRDGFVVCPGLLGASELAALQSDVANIALGQLGEVRGVAAAPEGTNASTTTVLERYLAFHHPHKLSPVLAATMRHERVVAVLRELIGSPNVKSMQSMYFIKAPGKPGQAWHQDENYIPTRDRSLVGAWVAIEDADVENGCLWMHPGSHRAGVIYPMQPHGDERFDATGEAYGFPYDPDGGVACEVRAGTVVFFHGYVLHRSLANVSPNRSRHAFVMHFMSAESLLPWDADGTIVPFPHDNRDVILVSGVDPYAHKGYVSNLTVPFVRPAEGAFGSASLGAAAALQSPASA